MAKTAGKKKATSAHRKVQSATTRSRKSVKRTTNAKKAASTTKKQAKERSKDQVKVQAKVTGSAETTKIQKKPAKQAKIIEEKPESPIETIVPAPVIDHKAPEIILHDSRRMEQPEDSTEGEAEEILVRFKKDIVVEPVAEKSVEDVTEESVEDVLQEVIEKQEQVARTVRADRQSAQELKDSAIEKALVEASIDRSRREKTRPKTRRVQFGFRRVVLALACAAAAVFAIVYFVNLNTPDVSLKVAAMQSGIDAKYPSYVPRDYNLSDITSENGKITLNFRNPTTGDAFTIIEEKSSWDSSALVSNYVRGAFGDDYSQIEEQGLTLFVNGSDAAWVNGGVAYKLKTTSGSLTKKQIKSIATSL